MIIIAVVANQEDYDQLKINSFLRAARLGYTTIVVKPVAFKIHEFEFDREIEVAHFSRFGEANIAIASKLLADGEFLLHVDPDEFYPTQLLEDISNFVADLSFDSVGLVKMQYYFRDKALNGTPWGGIREFPRIATSMKFRTRVNVHERLTGKEIRVESDSVVKHFWAESFKQIVDKHNRYLPSEGPAKFQLFGVFEKRKSILRIIRSNFGILRRLDIRDGLDGIFLSIIFSHYILMAEIQYYRYSRKGKL